MESEKKPNTQMPWSILTLSLALVVLIILVSLVGLLVPDIYLGATPNWLAQSVGQDAVDLFLVVPILVVGTLYSFRLHRMAMAMWVGTLLYITYTFLIYCFAVRFNILFIPYCLILGASFYSLVWFFNSKPDLKARGTRVMNITGVYFITIAVIFYTLWLIEIIPATINQVTPATILETGLYTNPVHVIDLAFFLPGTFIVGVMAIKKKETAIILAPALLVFFILMDLSIATLSIVLLARGISGSYLVAGIMGVLAIFSLALLIALARSEDE